VEEGTPSEGGVVVMMREDTTSATAMRAVYNWLFRGSEVYLLSEPGNILKTVRINWDAGTTDLQDADGKVLHDIPWTDIEFLHPDDFHIAGDDD
jgi:hypothetical protein